MDDVIDIIISAIKNARKLEKVKVVRDDFDAHEVASVLAVELDEIQKKVSMIIKENLEQKSEILHLKTLVGEEQGFSVKYNVYFTPDGDGPFCPCCYDNRGKTIRVRRETMDNDSVIRHACRVCGSSFSE